MIKEIKVKWIHWIDFETKFHNKTVLQWESKIWKTTVLNSIMAWYSWYFPWYGKSLPEWEIEIKTDDWDILVSNKKIVSNIQIDKNKFDLIRYIVPWNFFRLTKWTPEQREIITKLIWLDTSILDNLTSDIKDIKSKIKEFDNKKEQITTDILRLEETLEQYSNVTEPIKPELKEDNSKVILEAYDKLVNTINLENKKIRAEYDLLLEDYNRDYKNAEEYKSKEIRELSNEINKSKNRLLNITEDANILKSNQPYNCTECWTLIQPTDNTVKIDQLRLEYKEVKDNLDILEKDLSKIFEEQLIEKSKIKELDPIRLKELPNAYTLESKSELVWIKYIPWSTEWIQEYNNAYSNYISSNARSEQIQSEIDIKTNQLKDMNPTVLEMDLKKKEKEKNEFNKNVEDKVKQTWLDIRLFETLKNWNTRETFEIYDEEWYNYNATSTGNAIYIEVLIAKLFVDYLWLDFILIDRYESIWPNLRIKIDKVIWNLQLIVTEVSKWSKIKVAQIK